MQTTSVDKASSFLIRHSSGFIGGHNFIDFDMEIIKSTSFYLVAKKYHIIDTLPLSLLLLNEKTLHKLPKNYKDEDNFKNNPVKDSELTRDLFEKIEEKFNALEDDTKTIFYNLLKENKYFIGFFEYRKDTFLSLNKVALKKLIINNYGSKIINLDYLSEAIENTAIELAYVIALWTPYSEVKSHPPKILYDYPNIIEIQKSYVLI